MLSIHFDFCFSAYPLRTGWLRFLGLRQRYESVLHGMRKKRRDGRVVRLRTMKVVISIQMALAIYLLTAELASVTLTDIVLQLRLNLGVVVHLHSICLLPY